VNNPVKRNTPESEASLQVEGRSPYLLWLIWILWVPLIIPSLVFFFQAHPSIPHIIITITGVALFFALYFWESWLRARQLVGASSASRHPANLTWLTITILVALSLVVTLIGGNEWLNLFFYVSGFIGGSLTTRRSILVALIVTALVTALGWLIGLSWLSLVQSVVFIPAIIFIMRSILWSITTSWELRAAREEIARLAVVNERLRIARDLHDLLGHSLSLIALKSELAGRLVYAAPERAATEIRDIEQVARTTLQEVREAVASYRQPTLANELHAAQEILSAAGITYRIEGAELVRNDLPTGIEAALSWTVREGVTNVIKHSPARECQIKFTRDHEQVRVEISNDGAAASQETNTVQAGNGLRGLRERVASLGGQIEAEPGAVHGFSLSVAIPLNQKNIQTSISGNQEENSNVHFDTNMIASTQEHSHTIEEGSIQ
jgi:two-component system sensor histidine kinase DesK